MNVPSRVANTNFVAFVCEILFLECVDEWTLPKASEILSPQRSETSTARKQLIAYPPLRLKFVSNNYTKLILSQNR